MSTPTTYDITYQYSPRGKPDEWHTHCDLDEEEGNLMLRMLCEMSRNYRVRQNATGKIVEVDAKEAKGPLTLLHLFFKRISGRCGKVTDE